MHLKVQKDNNFPSVSFTRGQTTLILNHSNHKHLAVTLSIVHLTLSYTLQLIKNLKPALTTRYKS